MADQNGSQKQAAIGILVVAHGDLAQVLVETAQRLSGELSKRNITWASVDLDSSGERNALETMANDIAKVDEGAGVLVLADLFGGSAANLALAQLGDRVEVVTGANLAMVIDALCRNESSLEALAKRVAKCATDSVIVAKGLLESAA